MLWHLCASSLIIVRKCTVLQFDDEGSATVFLTIDSDSAAMLEDNLTTKTETDACAGRFGGKERNKSMFKDVRRHAAAVVFYADYTIAGTDLHLGSPTFVGILDKIDKHLLQLCVVGIKKSWQPLPLPLPREGGEIGDKFWEEDF